MKFNIFDIIHFNDQAREYLSEKEYEDFLAYAEVYLVFIIEFFIHMV
jgi:hypothetical protein